MTTTKTIMILNRTINVAFLETYLANRRFRHKFARRCGLNSQQHAKEECVFINHINMTNKYYYIEGYLQDIIT